MLVELIELWPGGPSIALGAYFVYLKYLFSLLLIVFAMVSFRWPRRPWILLGTFVLASVAFVGFDRPLGRPYGVVEQGRGLEDLGHVMVTATRGVTGDGRLVGEANPHPLWGLILAAMSGFDGERLWRLYRFVPWLSLLCLGCGVAFFSGALDERELLPRGTLSGLATFFVLFLSSHRLSFLESESTFWSESFWSTPQLGIALAGLCLCLRWLAGNSLTAWIAAALSFAFVGWMDPRLALLLAVGALPWLVVAKRWRQVLVLASGLVLFFPFRAAPPPVDLPAAFGSWYDAVSRVLSVTVDLGLVFVLAVVGVRLLLRSGRPRETLLGTCTLVALALWALASCVPAMAQTLGPRTLNAWVRMLLSVTAAYGLYRGLVHVGSLYPEIPEEWGFVPRSLRQHSTPRLMLSAFFLLSLPWCFPYWWMPVRMDPTYVASVAPLSRNVLAMSDAIREKTEPDAVFVAGASYAPWIPAIAGRRVLLAGGEPPDLVEREASERAFVFSRDAEAIASAAAEWDLTHLAWGRLDQPTGDEQGPVVDFTFFEKSPLFESRFRLRRWVRIFEYAR